MDYIARLFRIVPLENSLFASLIFVALGRCLAKIEVQMKHVYSYLIITFAIWIIEIISVRSISYMNDCFISLIPLTYFLCYIFVHKGRGFTCDHRISAYCRKCSILVYLIHLIIITFLYQFDYNNGMLLFVIALTISIILSFCVVSLSVNHPYSVR